MVNFSRQNLPGGAFVTTTGNIAKDGLLVVGSHVDDNEGHLLGSGFVVWGISGFVGSPSHCVRILFYEPDAIEALERPQGCGAAVNPMCSGLKLLTPGNPKTVKGEKRGFVTFILHLAPAKLSGFQVCPMATTGCAMACLNTAGRGGMARGNGRLTVAEISSGARSNTIQAARIRKTRLFFTDRESFMAQLAKDIKRAIAWTVDRDLIPVFRLNGTSDIRFETVRTQALDGLTVFEAFPQVQFYDYTKIANRKNLPANYHLTFSLADGNDKAAAMALDHGMNVAAVFRDKATVARYEASGFVLAGLPVPVLNGDETDLRFLDNATGGAIIGLYAKGNAKGDQSGFVRD